MIRTHGAGTLRATDAGHSVTLAGWVARRRDHGGVAFVDLRDASGVVQVVVRDEILAASGAHDLRNEYCVAVIGTVEARPEGNANLRPAHRRDRGGRQRDRGAQSGGARCRSRSTSGSASARRSGSSTATWTCADPARQRRSGCAARSTEWPATCCRRARLRRGRDPDHDPLDAGGRARLPGARPAASRFLVRPAAEPAAVQAAAHGGRAGALLPDRPVLPRRGLPGRPAAGVHPAGRRDELRRPGRRHRTHRGADHRDLGG